MAVDFKNFPTNEQIAEWQKRDRKFAEQNIQGAKEWASKGYYVGPVKPTDKKPAVESWDAFTSSPTEVDALFGRATIGSLIGVLTGESNIIVFDFDKKAKGMDSYRVMCTQFPELLDTHAHSTRSGGMHVVFRNPGIDVTSRSKAFEHIRNKYPGVDIKARRGLTVFAPSVDEAGEYKTVNDKQVIELPEVLKILLDQACLIEKPQLYDQREAPTIRASLCVEKFPACISQLLRVLREQGLGHEERLVLAGFLKSIGLEKEQVIEFFKATSNFNYDKTKKYVEGLFKSDFHCYKCKTLKASGICPKENKWCGEYSPLFVYANTVEEPDIKLVDLKPEIFKASPEIRFIVQGLVKEHDCIMFVGLPESYKSWFAYAIAVHVALGKPIGSLPYTVDDETVTNGRETRPGPVIIIEADTGCEDTKVRLQKILRGLGIQDESKIPEGMLIRLEANIIDLSKEPFRKKLTAALKTVQAACKGDVTVIFDNLRSLAGDVDENSVQEMKPVLQYAHDIAKVEGFTTLLLHHTTKDGKNYAGTGSIKSWVDGMIIFQTNDLDDTVSVTADRRFGGKDRFNCIRPMAFKFEDVPNLEGPAIKMVEAELNEGMMQQKVKKSDKVNPPLDEAVNLVIGYIQSQKDSYSVSAKMLESDIGKKYPNLVKKVIVDAVKEIKDGYKTKYTSMFRLVDVSGGKNFQPPVRTTVANDM